jgi:hypothetical protein
MKRRMGFVTNSSSTAYLLVVELAIKQEDVDKNTFLTKLEEFLKKEGIVADIESYTKEIYASADE